MAEIVIIAGIALGVIAISLDLGSRLFGSYARTWWGGVLRIGLITLAVLWLALPLCFLILHPQSTLVRAWGYVFSALGVLLFLHYVFPYRRGIRRILREQDEGRTTLPAGIVMRRRILSLSSLPGPGNELELLVLSDFHCNDEKKLASLNNCIEVLSEDRADCVLILGDFGENESLLPYIIEGLEALPSRLGTFCVRGNHDFERGRDKILDKLLARSSLTLLPNTAHHLPDKGLTLLGIERPWNRATLPNVPSSDFVIGLTHTPDNLPLMCRSGVDLAFAGHTHGGRCQLPKIGSLLVPCRLGRFLAQGTFGLGSTTMIVTTGVGYFPGKGMYPGEILRVKLAKVH